MQAVTYTGMQLDLVSEEETEYINEKGYLNADETKERIS